MLKDFRYLLSIPKSFVNTRALSVAWGYTLYYPRISRTGVPKRRDVGITVTPVLNGPEM